MKTREEIDAELKNLQYIRAPHGYFVDVITLLHMYNFMCHGDSIPTTYLALNGINANRRCLKRFRGTDAIIEGVRAGEVEWDTRLSNRTDGTRGVLHVRTDLRGNLTIGTT